MLSIAQPPISLVFESSLEADSFAFLVRTFKALLAPMASSDSSSFHQYVASPMSL